MQISKCCNLISRETPFHCSLLQSDWLRAIWATLTTDMFLSKLKIVIGFYQVTYGLLEMFSYIEWPDSVEAIGKYSGLLQMNTGILQLVPVHYLFPGFHVNAFVNLIVTIAINAAVIGFCGVVYGINKVLIIRSSVLEDEEKSRKVSQRKELVCRNLFFFFYVAYLSTC